MGGIGSGNFRRTRYFVEECLSVRLPDLRRLGLLKPGHMRSAHLELVSGQRCLAPLWVQVDADLNGNARIKIRLVHRGKTLEQTSALVPTAQPLGGYQWFAVCPISGKRCRSLLLPPDGTQFASVTALGLTYAVQSMDAYGRAHRRAQRAVERLGGMSRYTRHPTRRRLWADIWERDNLIDQLADCALAASAAGERLEISKFSRQTRSHLNDFVAEAITTERA